MDLEADPLLLSSRMTYSLSLYVVKASLSNFGVCIDEANDKLEVSCEEFRFPSFFNPGGELIRPETWLGMPMKDLAMFSLSDFRPNFTSGAY